MDNEVRLWLSVIAYKLGNLWRRLVLRLHIRELLRERGSGAERGGDEGSDSGGATVDRRSSPGEGKVASCSLPELDR